MSRKTKENYISENQKLVKQETKKKMYPQNKSS